MIRILIIMGILTSILNFLGCSGQTRKNDKKFSKEMADQVADSIAAFNNRPKYTELSEQIIDSTSDDDLLQIVFDNLVEKLPKDYKKEFETVTSWNKSRQAIFMIWLLEAEVNNGGFNQFYFNQSGQYYKYLPAALRLVGAPKFGDLTERANATFETSFKKITKYWDGTLEGFSKSYEDNPLNDFDAEFYELYKVENLQQIQSDYIRKQKKEFIDN